MSFRYCLIPLTCVSVALLWFVTGDSATLESQAALVRSDDPALERARREVRLLDDIYKTSIVLITKHYVNDDDDLAAGSAFKALFAAVEEKGWHEVRLIDASGEAYNDENSPDAGFEQRAVNALLDGKPSFEEVEEGDDGQRYLRAATAIPVVMDKCIMCHENYRDVPAGQAIGAIGYRLPILSDEAVQRSNQ